MVMIGVLNIRLFGYIILLNLLLKSMSIPVAGYKRKSGVGGGKTLKRGSRPRSRSSHYLNVSSIDPIFSLSSVHKVLDNTSSSGSSTSTGSNIKLLRTPRAQQPLITTNGTYLFVAGLGGTGHHYWQGALQACPYCSDVPEIRGSLSHWWYDTKNNGKENRKTVLRYFQKPRRSDIIWCLNTLSQKHTGMISYPNNAHRTKYPRVDELAKLSKQSGVKLIVLVLLRDATSLSSSIERRFNTTFAANWGDVDRLHPAVAAMLVQAQVLKRQLQSLDTDQYVCIKYEDTKTTSHTFDKLVKANFNQTSSSEKSSLFSFASFAKSKFDESSSKAKPSKKSKVVVPNYLHPLQRENQELIDYCFNNSAYSVNKRIPV